MRNEAPRTAMRITSVSTAVIEANFDWTLVRIDTDAGISGYGEAFFNAGLPQMISEFGPVLCGEDPLNVDPLWSRMRWAASAEQAAHAISGIETALLDLKGKALGVPVYNLLGGAYRNRVRVYLDCHAGHSLESLGPLLRRRSPAWMGAPQSAAGTYWDAPQDAAAYTPSAYAAAAAAAVGRGYTALKFDLDVPTSGVAADPHSRMLAPAELEQLVALVEATVAAVPASVEVAFDCHWRFSLRDATRLAKAVEHTRVAWLEDPVQPSDVAGLRQVRDCSSTPVGSGENWYWREPFRAAVEAGALDLVLPDVQKCGGLREAQRIAELSDLHDLAVCPHNISGPVGTMASAHLAAAIPNFLALEFHAADVPFFDELAATPAGSLIREGFIELTDAPGLGIELDMDAVNRYAKPGEPVFAAGDR